MKNKIKSGLFFIFVILFIISGLSGCAGGKKYFTELKSSYMYYYYMHDKSDGILKKLPSELTWEPEELLSYNPEDRKTQILEYQTLSVTLPKRASNTDKISDYKITMAYTVYNGKLIFTEVPIQYEPHEYFIIDNSIDSVIVTVDNYNAYLVNLNDASYKKLYNGENYAKTISISPDGKYLLYLSENSADIYSYDIAAGTETKLMNFANKEFLCWEKNDPGNFLFRDATTKNGKKVYSDIYIYFIKDSTENRYFSAIPYPYAEEEYISYEMIGDKYIYTTETIKSENTKTETIIYITDIYTGETITINAGKYSMIWYVAISESKEYIAFFGSYINADGIAIPEIVTVNTETNNMIAQYEQSVGEYFIDSFSWCPDNVLAVNFLNTIDLYNDLCRLLAITH